MRQLVTDNGSRLRTTMMNNNVHVIKKHIKDYDL